MIAFRPFVFSQNYIAKQVSDGRFLAETSSGRHIFVPLFALVATRADPIIQAIGVTLALLVWTSSICWEIDRERTVASKSVRILWLPVYTESHETSDIQAIVLRPVSIYMSGRPHIAICLQMREGGTISDVVFTTRGSRDRVRDILKDLRRRLPDGIRIDWSLVQKAEDLAKSNWS